MALFFDANVATTLGRIADTLAAICFQLSKPGLVQIVSLNENGSSNMISFKVLLPTLSDMDVVSRELSVQVGDLPPDVRPLPTDAVEATDYSGPQDAPVKLSLVDIDDAGNRSEASTLDVVLSDVFPPTTPGVLSIIETGERTE